MTPKYIYGPINSRRLGRSLGIDLVPYKTCSFDCIYCQLGRTTNKTVRRAEYVPIDEVIHELQEHLTKIERPDYITLSGSGEPTLHLKLGQLIDRIKKITDIPVAIITNSSLMHLQEVRNACAKADLVVPSLDAGDSKVFKTVNRPHPDISFEMVVDGLVKFRKEYKGQIWLEVLLVGGITDTIQEIKKIRKAAELIRPEKIQINTVARPAAEDYALPIPEDLLHKICASLGKNAEVIATPTYRAQKRENKLLKEKILSIVKRRPSPLEEIAQCLGAHPNEIVKYLDQLSKQGRVQTLHRGQKIFYSFKKGMKNKNEKI